MLLCFIQTSLPPLKGAELPMNTASSMKMSEENAFMAPETQREKVVGIRVVIKQQN